MPGLGYQTPRHAPRLRTKPAPPASSPAKPSFASPEAAFAAMLEDAKLANRKAGFTGWPVSKGREKGPNNDDRCIRRVMDAMPESDWITADEICKAHNVNLPTARKWLKLTWEAGHLERKVSCPQTNKLVYRRLSPK